MNHGSLLLLLSEVGIPELVCVDPVLLELISIVLHQLVDQLVPFLHDLVCLLDKLGIDPRLVHNLDVVFNQVRAILLFFIFVVIGRIYVNLGL